MKRFLIYSAALLIVLIGIMSYYWRPVLYAFIVITPFLVLVIHDLSQTRHTLLRNYPVFGHIRFVLEDFRHQIRQYFIQSNLDKEPFSREQRSLVYKRAKAINDTHAFGTLHDVYEPGYEWFEHSAVPIDPVEHDPRIQIGGPACSQPYSASLLNISAMSFGALSSSAITALNSAARQGGFAHNTGEGGISRHHSEPGGDLIWQIGTGYFGCRMSNGQFDAQEFSRQAARKAVKMIELKLSQGAKPGGGGVLPGSKVTKEIAESRDVPVGETVESPPAHSAFNTPLELMQFIQELRDLSCGKPVGFKLCIGQKKQFLAICKAMLDSGILPDFITVDGSEGGTGAAGQELSDSFGTPLRDALVFVHNALTGAGLREDIRVIASGKIISGFDMAAKIAMGADLCNSARGMMFALGCIQARKCNENTCPTGVATQDPWRVHGLVVSDKVPRVLQYHQSTVRNLMKVLGASGLTSSEQLQPEMLKRRVTLTETSDYREIFNYLKPHDLLNGNAPEMYQKAWALARPESFN